MFMCERLWEPSGPYIISDKTVFEEVLIKKPSQNGRVRGSDDAEHAEAL